MDHGWRKYIDFEVPEAIDPSGVAQAPMNHDPVLRQQIESALDDLWANPHTRDLIRSAARGHTDGKFHVWPMDEASFMGGVAYELDGRGVFGFITVPSPDSQAAVVRLPTRDGLWCDMSMHRALVHEMVHLKRGVVRGLQIDAFESPAKAATRAALQDGSSVLRGEEERQTILETNRYMAAFGEPARDPNAYSLESSEHVFDLNGRPDFERPGDVQCEPIVGWMGPAKPAVGTGLPGLFNQLGLNLGPLAPAWGAGDCDHSTNPSAALCFSR